MDDKTSVDISSIDWNNLTPEEFHALELKMQEDKKALKAVTPRKKRETGEIPVILRGKSYIISKTIYNRLKSMKSEKSREKLIDEIIVSSNSIEEL